MKSEVLLALLTKKVEERLEAILPTNSRGPRGQRGPKGLDGKDFNFAEHEETVKEWAKSFALKFEDLKENEIEKLRGPKGRDGNNGRDGLDFNFEEHEEKIKSWAKEFALKFEDLTADEINKLRGPRGLDGRDGKDFEFEVHRESITTVIQSLIEGLHETLRLKFNDLSVDEIEQIRGPRGRDGRDGKDFNFDEHIEYFNSLKLKFTDLTEEEVNKLKLRFIDLTEEEKTSLKLKFSDLTDEERISIRGPRGLRGQRGSSGKDGLTGPMGPMGPMGIRGLQGIAGLTGPKGISGRDGIDGRDGKDGQDAPIIVSIDIERQGNNITFVFEFSDGSIIRSESVSLPSPVNIYNGGGGSWNAGTGGGPSSTANALVVTKIAGETVSAGKAVYSHSSTEVKISDNAVSGRQHCIGIAKTAGNIGDSVEIILDGIYSDSLFSGFTLNESIWVGNNGTLTQTPPSSGVLLEVGYYLGENKIEIEIERPIILA